MSSTSTPVRVSISQKNDLEEVDENARPLSAIEIELLRKNDELNECKDEVTKLKLTIQCLQTENKEFKKKLNEQGNEIQRLSNETELLKSKLKLIMEQIGVDEDSEAKETPENPVKENDNNDCGFKQRKRTKSSSDENTPPSSSTKKFRPLNESN